MQTAKRTVVADALSGFDPLLRVIFSIARGEPNRMRAQRKSIFLSWLGAGDQLRFLKRQLALPVSTMSR